MITQSITNPLGLSVFGSALLRVAPDVADITVSVSSLHAKPVEAFDKTKKRARAVRSFLESANVGDVQSSRTSLYQEWEGYSNKRVRGDYVARVTFNVILDDLDRVEEVVSGVVEAGVNEVDGVNFQSRELRQYRMEARRQAVAAAHKKAQTYAEAANVALGRILHIEDVNPDSLWQRYGHIERSPEIDEEGPIGAFDPGAIPVGAAVMMVFSLASE